TVLAVGDASSVLAVPVAPQAGLNNGFPRLQTLGPAEKKQAVPAPQKRCWKMRLRMNGFCGKNR
ncbi:MAG: hypothetical protein V3U45_06380, partial [bacterium]